MSLIKELQSGHSRQLLKISEINHLDIVFLFVICLYTVNECIDFY